MHATTMPRERSPADPRTRILDALRREHRRRLAALERYDQYIAEAAGDLSLQAFWRNLRRQDVDDAQRLKNRLDREDMDGDRWWVAKEIG